VSTVPRRCDLERCTPAELAIRTAIVEVEKVGADERLTRVVLALDEAREQLADIIDGVVRTPAKES
jgi:hypothetical protein